MGFSVMKKIISAFLSVAILLSMSIPASASTYTVSDEKGFPLVKSLDKFVEANPGIKIMSITATVDGYFMIQDTATGKWGLVDTDTALTDILPPIYDYIDILNKNRILVTTRKNDYNDYRILDHTGKLICSIPSGFTSRQVTDNYIVVMNGTTGEAKSAMYTFEGVRKFSIENATIDHVVGNLAVSMSYDVEEESKFAHKYVINNIKTGKEISIDGYDDVMLVDDNILQLSNTSDPSMIASLNQNGTVTPIDSEILSIQSIAFDQESASQYGTPLTFYCVSKKTNPEQFYIADANGKILNNTAFTSNLTCSSDYILGETSPNHFTLLDKSLKKLKEFTAEYCALRGKSLYVYNGNSSEVILLPDFSVVFTGGGIGTPDLFGFCVSGNDVDGANAMLANIEGKVLIPRRQSAHTWDFQSCKIKSGKVLLLCWNGTQSDVYEAIY